jgi:hypothetical protein
MSMSTASLPPATPDEHCPTHGRVLHALVHEAGHAVIGNLHNITYDTVSVPATPGPADPTFGASVGGGLNMGRMPETWVPNDPVCALEMLMAGRAAEQVLLGHDLPESYRGDATVWGWGMRAHPDVVDGGGQAAAVAALGEPLNAIVDRTAELVETLIDKVVAVASALYDSSDWTLTNAEVVALL